MWNIKHIVFFCAEKDSKIAFPEVTFVDSITNIIPKYYKYTTEKDNRRLISKIHKLYVQKTLTEYKEIQKQFNEMYNGPIHKKLSQKYLSNIENLYKYSYNIRLLLFKHSANIEYYDKIRLSFDSNKNYILNLNEIYDKLEEKEIYFGYTSFRKREWTLILNDLIKIYPDIDFI